MELKKLFELAGIDTTKGKAKNLIESPVDPDEFGHSFKNPTTTGLRVWLDKDRIAVITDLPPTTTQEEFFDMVGSKLSGYEAEGWDNMSPSGYLVKQSSYNRIRRAEWRSYTLEGFIEAVKAAIAEDENETGQYWGQ